LLFLTNISLAQSSHSTIVKVGRETRIEPGIETVLIKIDPGKEAILTGIETVLTKRETGGTGTEAVLAGIEPGIKAVLARKEPEIEAVLIGT
jgi:hypothetical protein